MPSRNSYMMMARAVGTMAMASLGRKRGHSTLVISLNAKAMNARWRTGEAGSHRPRKQNLQAASAHLNELRAINERLLRLVERMGCEG